MAFCTVAQFLLPVPLLTHPVGRLPVLGVVPIIGLTMMLTGAGWSLVHTNSIPMVVDMTTPGKVGTYIGLYYLFSTVGAIVGPIINGWIIELSGMDYSMTMLAGPFFLLLALGVMLGARRGEAVLLQQPA